MCYRGEDIYNAIIVLEGQVDEMVLMSPYTWRKDNINMTKMLINKNIIKVSFTHK